MDLLLEEGDTLSPIEIKSGQTYTAEMVAGLNQWLRYAGASAGFPCLIYGGDEGFRRLGVEVRSWRESVAEA